MPVEPFTALAEVYRSAGLAEYSVALATAILNLAFDIDWTGRTLLDLGCGTGDLACWFAGKGMRVTGIDLSPAMLRYGASAAQAQGVGVEFMRGDMRAFKTETQFDMVLCVGNTINYAPTLRDLDSVIRCAYAATEPGKLFIFDMRTVQGLAANGSGDRIVSDKPDEHFIAARSTFSYETLTLTTQYTIFQNDPQKGWSRADEIHLLRGYPIQGVTRAITGAGFKLLRTLTLDMQDVENQKNVEQVIFVAQRSD